MYYSLNTLVREILTGDIKHSGMMNEKVFKSNCCHYKYVVYCIITLGMLKSKHDIFINL